jgi:hypothetical protein
MTEEQKKMLEKHANGKSPLDSKTREKIREILNGK